MRGRIKFETCLKRTDLLGAMPDRQVAEELGCSGAVVFLARRALGIAPYRRHTQRADSTGAKLAACVGELGMVTDKTVALKAGVSVFSARKRRCDAGIVPFRNTLWIPEALADLGKMADVEVVRKHGLALTRSALQQRRKRLGISAFYSKPCWLPAVLRRLGKQTDSSLAAEMGVSAKTVGLKRAEMGISKYRKCRK